MKLSIPVIVSFASLGCIAFSFGYKSAAQFVDQPAISISSSSAGAKALELIKKYEDFSPKAYKDLGGDFYVIGYGSSRVDGKSVQPGDTITREKALEVAAGYIREYEQDIKNDIKISLTENQVAALISFYYNTGDAGARRTQVVKLLQQGDKTGAARSFTRYTRGVNGKYFPGLLRRRLEEQKLFQT
jgi:lysozyme